MRNNKITDIVWAQLAAAVSYVVMGVLAITLMGKQTIDLVTNYLTNNLLTSNSGTVFVGAQRQSGSPELRVLAAVMMFFALFYPVLFLLRYKKSPLKTVKAQIHKLRWFDMAVGGTIGFLIVAALNGVSDVMTLVAIGGLMTLAYVFCWQAVHNLGEKKVSCNFLKVSVASSVLAWLVVLVSLLGTLDFGMVRSPWSVYVLTLLSFLYTAAMYLMYYYMKNKLSPKKDNLWFEKFLILKSFGFKVVFVLILILGFSR